MELHPFLEKDTCPNSGIWYVLSAFGDCPSMRVGHTCSYILKNNVTSASNISNDSNSTNGKILVIGGANPSGPFAEMYILDLDTFSWDTIDATGLRARYEHAAFTPQSYPDKVYVFGGADQSGNHNDLQVYDTGSKKWSTVTTGGNAPTPRTYHNHICVGDQFVVYSGGQCGSDPVGDRQVHIFNAQTNAWNTLSLAKGGDNPPKPRHGHLVLGRGNKIYIHGGMSGTHFYQDLHVLDLEKKSWRLVKQKKGMFPCARAGHGGVITEDDGMYIFGGMNRDGALDDMWRLSLDDYTWSRVELQGPPPASRLDFGMCVVKLRVPIHMHETVEDIVGNSLQAKEVIGTQLRMGSGGSVRSSSGGSAGSHRSVVSLGSASGGGATASIVDATPTDLGFSPQHLSPSHSNSSSSSSRSSSQNSYHGEPHHKQINHAQLSPPHVASCSGEPPSAGAAAANGYDGPTKTVEVAVVIGGMDTEGEIFDDVLVFLLKDHGPDVVSDNGTVNDEQLENQICDEDSDLPASTILA